MSQQWLLKLGSLSLDRLHHELRINRLVVNSFFGLRQVEGMVCGGSGGSRYIGGCSCMPLPLFPEVVDIHTTGGQETQSSSCGANHCSSKRSIYMLTIETHNFYSIACLLISVHFLEFLFLLALTSKERQDALQN